MPGSLDAATLRRAMGLYLDALTTHRDELDSLNVYPVPDGDTGTNLLMTQGAVAAALRSAADEEGLSAITSEISQASLMGARGNSGVILSQVLRAFCEGLPEDHGAGGEEVAAALTRASEEAFRAVASPREGTMLSVLGDAARAAAATGGSDPAEALAAALDAARSSLARTRDLLPELRAAGVIDAGGKGIVLLLDALHAAVAGVPQSEPIGPAGPVGRGRVVNLSETWQHSFEVQYLLEAPDGSIAELEAQLEDLGDSVVVVGGRGLYHVHVHTDQPDRAVALGHETGRPTQASVLNLAEQVAGCAGNQARAVRVGGHPCGLVAVAEGEGLAATLRSLGAVVVDGASPSLAEAIAAAISSVPSMAVVVVVGGGPGAPSVRRAAPTSNKSVRVIATNAIPAQLSAAAAFNPSVSLQENAEVMEEAAQSCRSGEVVRAEGNGQEPARAAERVGWLGLVDRREVAAGDRAEEVAVGVTRRLIGERSEVLTLVVGEGAGGDRAAVERALRGAFGGLEFAAIDGGQAEPPYAIGVE